MGYILHSAYGSDPIPEDTTPRPCRGPAQGILATQTVTCDAPSCKACRAWCGYWVELVGDTVIVTFPKLPNAKVRALLKGAGYRRSHYGEELPDLPDRSPCKRIMWVGQTEDFPDAIGPSLHPRIEEYRERYDL